MGCLVLACYTPALACLSRGLAWTYRSFALSIAASGVEGTVFVFLVPFEEVAARSGDATLTHRFSVVSPPPPARRPAAGLTALWVLVQVLVGKLKSLQLQLMKVIYRFGDLINLIIVWEKIERLMIRTLPITASAT